MKKKNKGRKFTKHDLVKTTSIIGNVNQARARDYINTVLYALSEFIQNMEDGDTLEIRGLGVFKVVTTRPLATGRHNPKTLEPVMVPARRKVLFYASKIIRKIFKRP